MADVNIAELLAELRKEVDRYAENNADVGKLGLFAKTSHWYEILALASFGLKAKAFLEEHGDALGAGLSLMEIETIEEREARDAARDALRAFSESARALTEAKGGK